jgi:hypothetical protein
LAATVYVTKVRLRQVSERDPIQRQRPVFAREVQTFLHRPITFRLTEAANSLTFDTHLCQPHGKKAIKETRTPASDNRAANRNRVPFRRANSWWGSGNQTMLVFSDMSKQACVSDPRQLPSVSPGQAAGDCRTRR